MKLKTILLVIGTVLLLKWCASSCDSNATGFNSDAYKQSAKHKLLKSIDTISDCVVILKDMDFKDDKYYHQYKVISQLKQPKDTIVSFDSPMYEVEPDVFDKYKDNLGMEIYSKANGVLNNAVSPPGYSNYVGNPQYGRWVNNNNNGSSFWEFYGKYKFLSSMFDLATNRVNRSWYDDYGRYRNRGDIYYGPQYGNNHYYGTRGKHSTYTKSKWQQKPLTFKDKVRSKVKRSVGSSSSNSFKSKVNSRGTRGSGFSSSKGSSSSNSFKSRVNSRVTRSSGRSSSSMRSRGGGYGK
ncbi:MAG: hypothetical protein ACEPOV_09575 [Hyphomicrobiales bacterium]